MRIRYEFGTVMTFDHLADAPQYVAALSEAVEFRKRGPTRRVGIQLRRDRRAGNRLHHRRPVLHRLARYPALRAGARGGG
jgi:hypothetical protein